MAIFSVNQARHIYVAKGALAASEAAVTKGTVGKVFLRNADAATGKGFYVKASTGKGDVLRSDIVYPGSVTSVSLRTGSSLAPKARKYSVSVSSDILDSDSKVPKGYTFILKIHYPTYQGMAEGESYSKLGDVYTRKALTPTEFLNALAASISRNVANEAKIWPILKVEVDTTGSDPVLLLTEVAQDWHRGTMAQEILKFNVVQVPVTIDTIATDWAVLTDGGVAVTGFANSDTTDEVPFEWVTATDPITGTALTNGRNVADLEYFFMGERGDLYRGIGWPNIVETKYIVDPDETYDILDIDFFWAGDAEDVQKSPRVLTVIAESGELTEAAVKATAAALGLKSFFVNGVAKTTA